MSPVVFSLSVVRGHSNAIILVAHFKGQGYILIHHSLLVPSSPLCVSLNRAFNCPDLHTYKAKFLPAPVNKQSFLELTGPVVCLSPCILAHFSSPDHSGCSPQSQYFSY